MRLLFVVFLVTLVASGAAVAAASSVRATMSTSATKPLAGTPWRYTITVKDQAGKPLAAKVRLQILRGTRVVGCWKGTAMTRCSGARAGTWIPFEGKRAGTITWPARLAEVKLTFLAIVVTEARSLRLRAPLIVRVP